MTLLILTIASWIMIFAFPTVGAVLLGLVLAIIAADMREALPA